MSLTRTAVFVTCRLQELQFSWHVAYKNCCFRDLYPNLHFSKNKNKKNNRQDQRSGRCVHTTCPGAETCTIFENFIKHLSSSLLKLFFPVYCSPLIYISAKMTKCLSLYRFKNQYFMFKDLKLSPNAWISCIASTQPC